MFARKTLAKKDSPATTGSDLEKRLADAEKQLAELNQWKADVAVYLRSLGFKQGAAEDVDSHDQKGGRPKLKKQVGDSTLAVPPVWFCSYCWTNSKAAYNLQEVKHYSGEADPREIWSSLQRNQLYGWLDKEYLGQAGLFDDIVEGLLGVKVMIAFVSDEYAVSDNCLAELTFARKSLRIPIIPVVVGNGWNWQKTKVGLLLSDALYIDMTDPSKRGQKLDELKARLMELLGSEKAYLEQTGQVKSIDEIKVGDAVERYANDPLNFDSSFMKNPIKDSNAGSHLFAWYWWPCEIIEIDSYTGAYKLHYWGYDDSWDHWVQKEERTKLIRPLQYPSLNIGDLKGGDRVEIRLFQDTHIADKNASKAYCWVPGTVVSCDGTMANVKVDLDFEKLGVKEEPPMVEGSINKFLSHVSGTSTGFVFANVTVGSVRRL